jgi:hypothetical protein
MTTIVSPSSTPVPVYVSEGRTIESLTASGNSAANATPIVRYAQTTIVMVTSGGLSTGVVVPTTAEIGDEIEVLADEANSFGVVGYMASGDTIDNAQTTFGGVSAGGVYAIRKVSASAWRTIYAH